MCKFVQTFSKRKSYFYSTEVQISLPMILYYLSEAILYFVVGHLTLVCTHKVRFQRLVFHFGLVFVP